MKALMIATEKLPVPPVRGGAIQTYIAGVAPILGEAYDLTILSRTDPALPKSETVGNIRYDRVPCGGDFKKYRQETVNFLKKESFDLIHIFNRPRLVRAVREAAPNSRIILSMHNDMFNPEKIAPAEAAFAIYNVERIITISDYIGSMIKGMYPQAGSKLHTIYAGVDLNRFRPSTSEESIRIREALRKKYRLTSKKVILYVGRLSIKKGVDILIRAVLELGKKHRDIALVLVGSNWYGQNKTSDYVAYLRSLAKRSPAPIITTGFVKPEEVHQWFWAGDIFVCPSQWQEPLARVHYEALASGLPIITTNRGGNPEVIRTTEKLIVETPEDPKSFAEKIAVLLDDPLLCKQMGDEGRRLAEQMFGWTRVADEIREVWEGKLSGAALT
ncbi:MAG: glycosyltransferase family 4 protein [Firmicutes bacterium]|nr:glycosyltransferase family 4 protein [Bacillota bacterium]